LRPDEQDDSNWTTLFWAVGGNHLDIIKELLLHHSLINVNRTDERGRTAISWAAGEGFLASLRHLLTLQDVDPNIEDSKHRSALSWAAGNGQAGAIKLLMKTNESTNRARALTDVMQYHGLVRMAVRML